jgi:enolase
MLRRAASSAGPAVPSGASTGEHEAVELRDGDKGVYLGKGVTQGGRERQREDRPGVIGLDAATRRPSTRLMLELDGTPNKAKLGANAILGVSMAVAHAAAEACRPAALPLPRRHGAKVLPVPMMNILNGGKHADNTVDFQEFMIQPWGFDDFARPCARRRDLPHPQEGAQERGLSTAVGDEGGFAPTSRQRGRPQGHRGGVEKAGYKLGRADLRRPRPRHQRAVERGREGRQGGLQVLQERPRQDHQLDEMIDYWAELVRQVPHPLDRGRPGRERLGRLEAKLTDKLGDKVQLVGDDLFVTNKKFLQRGIDTKGCANAILVKVNQIGTLSETFDTVNLAMRNGYTRRAQPPLGRDRGRHHRRHRRGDQLRPDQDRRPLPQRPQRQVQPAHPHRRGAGRG